MQADERRAEAAERRLALAADVEQPGVEGDGDREAGEDEVGRVVERVADALAAAERAAQQHGAVASSGFSPMASTTRPADQERRDDGERRHEHQVGPARQRDRRALMPRAPSTPAISRPSSRSSVVGGRALAGDAAVEHHEDAVGERHDLVELDRDEQDRVAGVAQRDEPAVDELDRADVDAARRLADQQHLRVRARSRARARSSAGCRRRTSTSCSARRARAHVVVLHLRRACRRSTAAAVEQRARPVARLVVVAEDGALAGREGRHEAHALAVLRHVQQAEPAQRVRDRAPARRAALPVEADRARRRRPRMPASASSSSHWPLPATPAMPTISPARTVEATRRRPAHARGVDAPTRSSTSSSGAPGLGRALLDAQQHAAADHQLGELGRRRSRRCRASPPSRRAASRRRGR